MSSNVQLVYKQRLSHVFSTARIYALISIVCAHIYFANGFIGTLFSRVGSIGVIVYLLISGYFYRTEKFSSFFTMLKRKAITLIVPWLILGSLTWLYRFFLFNNTSGWLLSYFNWIIGNGSYLYYLTVLFVCFFIFYKNNKATLVIAILLNISSNICTATRVLSDLLSTIGINNYLNFFNWIGFFAMGMLMQKVSEESIVKFLVKSRWVSLIFFNLVLILLIIFSNIQAHYFSFLAIPYELLGALCVIGLSTFDLTKNKILKTISNYSFPIYLIHLVFIGILDVVFVKSIVTIILSPVIIIGVCLIVLWCVVFISKQIKLEKVANLFLGIRDKSI